MSQLTGTLRLLALGLLPLLTSCDGLNSSVGSISGQVAIDGQGVRGIAVTLSDGVSAITGAAGSYRFDQVQGGLYTVTISGYPLDATFHETSALAEIVDDGQAVIVDFRGEYIRTASLTGRVTFEGRVLPGVAVRLAGTSERLTATDEVGQFAFESLRAGAYTVTISDFGEVEFATTSRSVSLAVGESKVLSFNGTYIRRSSISASVRVAGSGLQGVALHLAGQDEVADGVTDSSGLHTFTGLRAGTYTVEISGFDSAHVFFPTTRQAVAVAVDQTVNVVFDGKHLPRGSLVGQVSIEGFGIDGVSVALSNGAYTVTAGGGHYRFDSMERGSYTVTISGYPADASFDHTSVPFTIADSGGTVTVDFPGVYIRTAAILGTVTADNMGLEGVTVSLAGMADGQTTTNDQGQYGFTGLRAGTYSVEISGFDENEVGFQSTSGAATVGVGEAKVVSFDGTFLRTTEIQGQVSVDGEGLQGVTVTLTGQGEEATETTDAGGHYSFPKLRPGTYQVAISGYDPDDYGFQRTSETVTVGKGETANVPFEGRRLRTGGISGRVSLEDGTGLDGVTVTLAGAVDRTTRTSNGGQYAFAGLAAGRYVVTITNPNKSAFSFDTTQVAIELATAQTAIINFHGKRISQ